MKFIAVLLVLMNLATFIVWGMDKHKAKKRKWRIPESTLLLMAFLGGAPGALIGMKTFHHKTYVRKFKILVPVFLILQIAALLYFFYISFLK